MNETMSLVLATAILAIGGLGLYMYKQTDDEISYIEDENYYDYGQDDKDDDFSSDEEDDYDDDEVEEED